MFKENNNVSINIETLLNGLKLLCEGDKVKQRELIASLVNLMTLLKEDIPNYKTFLSDEAGGRLPTLFLYELTKKKYGGRQVCFLQGGRNVPDQVYSSINDLIEKRKKALGKCLLVTEHIDSGASIQKLMNVLSKAGVDYKVISVSISEQFFLQLKGGAPDSTEFVDKIIYSSVGEVGSFLKTPLVGVERKLMKLMPQSYPWRLRRNKNTHVADIRREIQLIADELSKLL